MTGEKLVKAVEEDPDRLTDAMRTITAAAGNRFECEFADGRQVTDEDLAAAAQRGRDRLATEAASRQRYTGDAQ